MNEGSDQTAVAEIPKNLKGIYQRLQEINEVLNSPKSSLDTLVNGDKPLPETFEGGKELDGSGSAPSIENLVAIVNNIDRTAHSISKYTNRLVGN